jgi:hypothetical protein
MAPLLALSPHGSIFADGYQNVKPLVCARARPAFADVSLARRAVRPAQGTQPPARGTRKGAASLRCTLAGNAPRRGAQAKVCMGLFELHRFGLRSAAEAFVFADPELLEEKFGDVRRRAAPLSARSRRTGFLTRGNRRHGRRRGAGDVLSPGALGRAQLSPCVADGCRCLDKRASESGIPEVPGPRTGPRAADRVIPHVPFRRLLSGVHQARGASGAGRVGARGTLVRLTTEQAELALSLHLSALVANIRRTILERALVLYFQ